MTPIRRVLSLLPTAKQRGVNWSALCPAHDDTKPSLSVSEGEEGQALVKCHAGCSVEDIVAALGLKVRDLMPDHPGVRTHRKSRPKFSPKQFSSLAAAVEALERQHGPGFVMWTYHDASGMPIGAVLRWDTPSGKEIRPVSLYSDGWRIAAMPEPRPLYRLPELARARVVIVAEGEKSADAARSLGFTATTSAGGSQVANKTDWRPLAGKEVWILPDNDLPGQKYADDVARILAKLHPAPVVKLVLLPDLPEKGDVVDWIAAHGGAAKPASQRAEIETRARAASPWMCAANGGANPPVRRLVVPEYQTFPVEALPPVLREYVTEISASVDCDPSFAALPALTLAGAAVGNALVIRVKRKYTQPPLLWACTVGESGTGKTPAFRPIEEQALRIDRGLEAKYRSALRKHEADLAAWESAEDSDPEAKPVRPLQERLAVIDATIERLTVESYTSPRGLIVVRDELDGWFSGHVKYKGKPGGSDVPNWLSMYEAGAVRYMRRTGEPKEVSADRAFVAVTGGIQPDVLKTTLSDTAFIQSGLAARFMFAWPPKKCPRWNDAELSPVVEVNFAEVLNFLRSLPFNPSSGPGEVGLDVVARARFVKLNNEFAQAAEETNDSPMSAVYPKAVRFALRLALIWHCASEAAARRDPGRGTVSDAAMAAGETLARWFVGEAERIYAMLAERSEDRDARQLAELVRRKGGHVRPRDLQRGNAQKYPTAEVAELALDALVSAGCGFWHDDPPKPNGGRPGRVFVLTPPSSDTRQNPTHSPGDDARS